MKKIISLFQRNYDGDRLVRNEVTPGAEWVIAGEGIATRKWDGTCCKIENAQLWKRYDAKKGKSPPIGFVPAQEPDPVTGHWPGWLPVGNSPDDQWHREAFEREPTLIHATGTWELCGPKVQGNPEKLDHHILIRHGVHLMYPTRTFDGIRQCLEANDIEGIVFHHPDGRMVKIKARDFGIKRKQSPPHRNSMISSEEIKEADIKPVGRCENCRYFGGGYMNWCRRHAPVHIPFDPAHHPDGNREWPRVRQDDWCGDFEKKP